MAISLLKYVFGPRLYRVLALSLTRVNIFCSLNNKIKIIFLQTDRISLVIVVRNHLDLSLKYDLTVQVQNSTAFIYCRM